MSLSRRDLIERIGAVGGYAAAYTAMQALGMLAAPAAFAAEPPDIAKGGGGKGAKVIILGAGIAGMTAAYELRRAGYSPLILEARGRTGGRNWTVRRGDVIDQTDGSRQVCDFDEGQYINAGPARLPSHHQLVLGYCRELGVELEVEVNTSRSALLLNPAVNGGKPIQMRRATNDARGHVSELLAKAIDRGALDRELTPRDKERMLAFLQTYGDLTPEKLYKGSERAGLKTEPGAGDERSSAHDPLDMKLLLDEDMWNGVLFEESIDMQATMFQPKGGMDQIPKAFEKALGPAIIKRNAEVKQVKKTEAGVRVVYRDGKTGKDVTVDGAYVISTIPLVVLAKVDIDLSPNYKAIVKDTPYRDSVKIAWQAPRFWEQPNYQIYGGISFVKAANSLVWYPSHGMHSKTGILLGAYSGSPELTRLPRAEQIEYTRKIIDQLHPGSGKLLEKPVHVQWAKIPFSQGISIGWRPDEGPGYHTLMEPDGRIYFAGDYLARVGAWQEGAMRSAHRTIVMLDAAHRKGAPVTATRTL